MGDNVQACYENLVNRAKTFGEKRKFSSLETQVLGSLNKYQQITRQTATYPGAGIGKADAVTYLGLGLGEAGEIQNKIKKIIRDDNGVITPERRDSIIAELGDLLWYVARLADELDEDLGKIAQDNIDKLLDRKERNVIKGSGDNR